MDFLVNYVSIWDKEWFVGLLRLLSDIVSVGALILFVLVTLAVIIVEIIDWICYG